LDLTKQDYVINEYGDGDGASQARSERASSSESNSPNLAAAESKQDVSAEADNCEVHTATAG